MDKQHLTALADLGLGLTVLCGPTCDGVRHGHKPNGAGKAPLRLAWQRAGYRTAAALLQDYANGCNLGVMCGHVVGAAVSVAVIDGDDAAALEWMRANLPATPWMVRTRHGEHWYYRAPAAPTGNRNLRKSHGLELDVRAAGGQVVSPGSVHRTGHVYEVIGEPWTAESAALLPTYDPAWLPAVVLYRASRAAPGGAQDASGAGGGAPAWVAPAGSTWPGPRVFSRYDYEEAAERVLSYAQRLPYSVNGSDGHGTAMQAALKVLRGFPLCSLHRLATMETGEGLPVDPSDAMQEAMAILSEHFNPRCTEADEQTPCPWSLDELAHKIQSAAVADRLPGPDYWLFDDKEQRARYARRNPSRRPPPRVAAPTLAHLAAVGLGLDPRPTPAGEYLIRCPWAMTHAAGAGEATISAGPRGDVFSCPQCEDRTVADLLQVARDPQRQARLGLSWTGAALPTRAEMKKEAAPEGGSSGAAVGQRSNTMTNTKRVTMDTDSVNGSDSSDTGSDDSAADLFHMAEALGGSMRATTAKKDATAKKGATKEKRAAADSDRVYHGYLSKEGADALIVSKSGAVRPIPANVTAILRCDERWKGVLIFNEFSQKIEKLRTMPSHCLDAQRDAGEWESTDTQTLRNWLARCYGFDCSDDNIKAGMLQAASGQTHHPIRAYLDGLKWDGVQRLGTWLHRYLGAEATPYTDRAGTYWLVSAVARAMQPGCKADYTLILEGPQGFGKSTAIAILGGAYYRSTKIDIHRAPDCYQALRGVWIYEMAELASFKKADGDDLKGYLTQPVDDYRDSYGHGVRPYPRQCVFAGSVNPDEARDCTYLSDPTGARRFWPVKCFVNGERADLDALTLDRDQLWAEAAHLYRQPGARWYPLGDEEAALFAPQQAVRSTAQQADPWDATVAQWLVRTRANSVRLDADGYMECHADGKPIVNIQGLTATAILEGALQVPVERRTQALSLRVGQCMRRMGWASADKVKSVGGHKCRPYRRVHADAQQEQAWRGLVLAADAAEAATRYRAYAILFTRHFGDEAIEELRDLGISA